MRQSTSFISHYKIGLWFLLILLCGKVHAQTPETEPADIDEWQVMRLEAAKNPFEHTDQFSINFEKYTVEEWCYPLKGAKVISHYGGKRRHAGTDLKTCPKDTIRAAFAGEVMMSGPYFAYGNFVALRHANGLETAYSHNVKNLVKKGQWVQAGHPLALVGRTGRATTEHLHFETRVHGKAFDSSILFDHANHTIRPCVFVFRKGKNGALSISSNMEKTTRDANGKQKK